MRPVTLEMLNRPIPYDHYIEDHCLQIMEHNTLIKYRFESGTMQDTYDPETEKQLPAQYKLIHPTFHVADAEPKSQQKKKEKLLTMMSHLTQNAQELKVNHLHHSKKHLLLISLPKDQHPQSIIPPKDAHRLK
jgi:hypothetical protein